MRVDRLLAEVLDAAFCALLLAGALLLAVALPNIRRSREQAFLE